MRSSSLIQKGSPNNHLLVLREVILGHRQVQRRRALPRAPGDVVVRAVAGAEPAAEVAGFANGDAAEVCAYSCCGECLVIGLLGLCSLEDGRDGAGGKGIAYPTL